MENRCNEWNCPHNQNGKCIATICVKEEEIYEKIHKNS